MYCPRCEGTQKLSTKRTIAGHRQVERERYCSKCDTVFLSVERFDIDIKSDFAILKDINCDNEKEIRDLKGRLDSFNYVLSGFKQLLENVKSG